MNQLKDENCNFLFEFFQDVVVTGLDPFFYESIFKINYLFVTPSPDILALYSEIPTAIKTQYSLLTDLSKNLKTNSRQWQEIICLFPKSSRNLEPVPPSIYWVPGFLLLEGKVVLL